MRVLIKEVEEARGGMISNDYLDPPILSSNTVSSSSQVISEHLVSFKYVIDSVFEANLDDNHTLNTYDPSYACGRNI